MTWPDSTGTVSLSLDDGFVELFGTDQPRTILVSVPAWATSAQWLRWNWQHSLLFDMFAIQSNVQVCQVLCMQNFRMILICSKESKGFHIFAGQNQTINLSRQSSCCCWVLKTVFRPMLIYFGFDQARSSCKDSHTHILYKKIQQEIR